jgi:hypothetical protein
LNKFSRQAYITSNVEVLNENKEKRDFIISSRDNDFLDHYKLRDGKKQVLDSINSYLEPKFNSQFKGYENTLKVFFLNLPGYSAEPKKDLLGVARSINSTSATILYRGYKVLAHEVFHALGLHHNFNEKAKYTFKKESTKNIMDYTKGNKFFSTSWQWKQLQASKLLRKEK